MCTTLAVNFFIYFNWFTILNPKSYDYVSICVIHKHLCEYSDYENDRDGDGASINEQTNKKKIEQKTE